MDNLDLPYYNTTNYPLAVKNQLAKIPYHKDENESKALHYHQFLVKEFFTRNPYQRGLLICHGMGQGKTRLAVSIAAHIKQYEKRRRINILLPKSLEMNFKNTMKSYTGQNDDYIDNNFRFVSLNASNMYKQMSNIDKSKAESDFEQRLGNFMEDMIKNNSLDNSYLIIDEAHNLFNSITNGAKNAMALYDLIMQSRTVRLIFLTGTPITNDPFELVPCFNMLRGYIHIDEGKKIGGDEEDSTEDSINSTEESTEDSIEDSINSTEDSINSIEESTEDSINSIEESTEDSINSIEESINSIEESTEDSIEELSKVDSSQKNNRLPRKSMKKTLKNPQIKKLKTLYKVKKRIPNKNITTLFSESIDEFENFFIDRDKKSIKNKDKFTNRIYGLTSYYGDLYFPTNINKPGFPKKLDTIIEKVPMSQTQFSRYILARSAELEETKRVFRGKDSRFSASKGGSSTYRVKSRQISNYCIPEYALGPVRGQKAREKFIDRITEDDLSNTHEFSPKLGKIFANVQKHNDTLGIVYSQFVSGEGLAVFARILEVNGYTNYLDEVTNRTGFDELEKPSKKYALLSGDIDPEKRSELIAAFNRPENVNGSIVSLLLLSGALAEGIDLKRIRHVHIMEPFWNFARINQVETRAIRYLSHADLPPEQQNVQVYIYLSDYPVGYPSSKIFEPTTDVELYTKSIDNMKIISTFMQAIAESSIDCNLHYPHLAEDIRKMIKCKLCSPNGMPLFHPLLNKDMLLPNNCTDYTEKKVTVEEIIWEPTGEKFYYNYDTSNPGNSIIRLYQFSKKLNGYIPMERSHYLYGKLMQRIITEEGN